MNVVELRLSSGLWKKSYNNSYEPVANWDKMLAFIDAANEWSNSKIVLKKKI
jgi:hypothetical protein